MGLPKKNAGMVKMLKAKRLSSAGIRRKSTKMNEIERGIV
jgi:hypothetical protein